MNKHLILAMKERLSMSVVETLLAAPATHFGYILSRNHPLRVLVPIKLVKVTSQQMFQNAQQKQQTLIAEPI